MKKLNLTIGKVNYNIQDIIFGIESFDYYDNCFYILTKNNRVLKIEHNVAKELYSLKGKSYLQHLKILKRLKNR